MQAITKANQTATKKQTIKTALQSKALNHVMADKIGTGTDLVPICLIMIFSLESDIKHSPEVLQQLHPT